ncbi:MAG: hypothetical protein N2999_03720 [Proteobacteria bacterium]|nr:hypothetical protein [Pseudomonadota bacterium]
MKVKIFLILSVCFVFLHGYIIDSMAENSCVSCHTDENKLKSLFIPKEQPPAEGEG